MNGQNRQKKNQGRRTPLWFWPAFISVLLALVMFFLVMILVPSIADSFISGTMSETESPLPTDPIVTRSQETELAETFGTETKSEATSTVDVPSEPVPTEPEPTIRPTVMPTTPETEPFRLVGSPASAYLKKAVERAKSAIVTIYVSMPERGDTPERAALFSGVIIDSEGRVVTPLSNLSFALTYNGRFHESSVALAYIGQEQAPFTVEMIEYDRNTDVALLKIVDPPSSVIPIEFAKEPRLALGDLLIALGGTDIGMTDISVSIGYLTGELRRTYFEDGLEMGMIQTSAFIPPIMSGAALVDSDGRMVGLVNTNVAKDYSDILGYALPVDVLVDVIDKLENKAPPSLARRVRLGVRVMAESDYLDLQVSRNYPEGLLIAEVLPDGPAASADIQAHDVLISIDGESVSSLDRLNALLNKRQVGERAMITLYRTETRRYFTTAVYLREMQD